MPPQEGMPPISDKMEDRIMHISLPISKKSILMGSDTGGEWGENFTFGNNFSISFNCDSMDEADQVFNALSQNGKVSMPLDKTFWNSYFGSLTDKFGINWMVSCALE